MSLTIPLIVLILILVGAVTAAAVALSANRRRAQVLSRAGGASAVAGRVPLMRGPDAKDRLAVRVGEVAERFLPEAANASDAARLLIQAGFESTAAPAIYALIRLVSAIAIPGAMFAWGPRGSITMLLFSAVVGIGLGFIAPPAILTRLKTMREERIRKSLPDCLDLLLVCVEAGVSLDAAILRVGREMLLLHEELSYELLMMNRRMNAGMRREDALHGLYERTGVPELRSLGANMIQSERWGTSIAQVLRVYSESLRRKRRQAAEKKAAVAATKMIFPLALFILPALFAVIGGPVIMGMGGLLDAFGGGR
jgi:tight adherence protein C